MNDLIKKLASLKLAVGLLVVLVGALAAGTIVESAQGTEAAGRLVYHSLWFRILLAALGVNTLFAIAERWPVNNYRIGFLVTHVAMVVILLGALVSEQFKKEGSLALWEGEQSSVYWDRMAGDPQARASLPFEVRLDSFEIDTYPGTQRPAMFRSRVTVFDYDAGIMFPAVIEMNKELSYKGWNLYQSSYQQSGGREMSVLSVSDDPGMAIVFIGYFLLMGGMATVIGTRVVQRRRATAYHARKNAGKAAAGAPGRSGGGPGGGKAPNRKAPATAGVAALLLLAGGWTLPALGQSAQAGAAPLPPAGLEDAVRSLPIQHDGRTMPLDTVAREGVWKVTGDESFRGLDPVRLALGWAFHPQAWMDEPVVEVGSDEVARAAGLAAGTDRAAFRTLAASPGLRELWEEARRVRAQEEELSPLLEDAAELESRLVWLQSFLERRILRTEPVPGDPNAQWGALPGSVGTPEQLAAWYRERRASPPAGWPPTAEMEREVLYNRAQPAQLSWIILAVATVASVLALRSPSKVKDLVAVGALLAGVVVMTWGIVVRWQVAERIPASNMYESMLFLGWGVGLFALIAAAVMRNRLVIFNAAAMAFLTMALVDLLPIDPFVHPMAPVLSGTAWLAIHVPIIMVSYSVLALGVLIAHMQIGIEIFRPAKREAAAKMNDLLYWYMHIGSLLLVAGIITGSIWAASSWGRYWGWDPKEVWSLIAFLAYMGILHSRFDRQIHAFGVAAASIVAFWTVLMTYIGVNFVLSAGLHSYGFGSGGVVQWMAIIGAAEIAFLGVGWFANRRNRRIHGPLPAAGV